MYLGIEGGGTTFVCAAGSGPDDLHSVATIPTTTPDETLEAVDTWVAARLADRSGTDVRPAAIGVATFGPLDLDPRSPTFGTMTATPKPGWQGTDLPGHLHGQFGLPIGIETDVSAAAVAEARWGRLRDTTTGAYLTVGTGVGGGLVVDGRPPRGLVHPEMGHLRVRRHGDDDFAGSCPFHGADCVEGMASGTAVAERFGRAAHDLDDDDLDHARTLLGDYLGQVVATIVLVCSPQRLVLGGGVSRMAGLHDAVRRTAAAALADTVPHPVLDRGAADLVVAPDLGDRAGVLGALAVAADVVGGERSSVSALRDAA